jgi:nitrogen fixation NifU-like protein
MNDILENDEFFGRMSDPTHASRIKGPCGDDMEFYLVIENDVIKDVKYFTQTGCANTRMAGRAVALRAKNKTILEALEINPGKIIAEEKNIGQDGRHCAILAVTTFFRAIADHLLESNR